MIAREQVTAAFRWLLDRAPETEAAITYHQRMPDEAAMRRAIIASPEFAALYRQMTIEPDTLGESLPLDAPPRIETEADEATLAALWARIARAWAGFGDRAHWSVLTFDDFKPDRLDDHRETFEATANADGRLIDLALARVPDLDPAATDTLEYGAGVGRATRALAARFARVRALDISAPHLEIAAKALADAPHVTFQRVEALADLEALAPVGFVYSRIVLQHNPPPLQAAVLKRLLARLAPGGIALFQVVTRIEGYAYTAAGDATAEGSMEMHALPQETVFERLHAAGCRVIEAVPDGVTGPDPRIASTLFLARRT